MRCILCGKHCSSPVMTLTTTPVVIPRALKESLMADSRPAMPRLWEGDNS